MPGPVLVPILGDQLTRDLASLRGRTKDDTVILMMEVWDEATYVRHHKQKIALIFSAMRHFAAELRGAGWSIDYTELGDPENAGSFTGEVARAIERHEPRLVSVVEAGEWRVRQDIEQWADKFACEVEILRDDRFICSQSEFEDWAEDRDSLRMEFFYREMRRKTGLLMKEDGKPEGGAWNHDSENRKPPKDGLAAPERPKFAPDAVTQEVIELVEARFGDHFGSLDTFGWPVTRDEAEEAADGHARGAHQLVVLRDQQVLQHRHAAEQTDVLEGAGNAKAGDLIGGAGQQIIAVKTDAPFGRVVEP